MRIVNLTPHAIVLQSPSGERTIIEPTKPAARVATVPGILRALAGLPCRVFGPTIYGEVDGLPDPEDGAIYLVSLIVLGRTSRYDVFAPGTGPNDGAVRNAAGQVEAVTRLIAAV